MNTYHVYPVCMSLTHNGSSALERYGRGNVMEIYNGIMFNFYLGLSPIIISIQLLIMVMVIIGTHSGSPQIW